MQVLLAPRSWMKTTISRTMCLCAWLIQKSTPMLAPLDKTGHSCFIQISRKQRGYHIQKKLQLRKYHGRGKNGTHTICIRCYHLQLLFLKVHLMNHRKWESSNTEHWPGWVLVGGPVLGGASVVLYTAVSERWTGEQGEKQTSMSRWNCKETPVK